MDTLPKLLVQNQNNLERLRMRVRYCDRSLLDIDQDFLRLYGPLSREWERCHEELTNLREEVREDVVSTAQFVIELKVFSTLASSKKRHSKHFRESAEAMVQLAKDALKCQGDMLSEADERIQIHRNFTAQLKLLESVDETNY